MTNYTIKITSDTVCPWCYIGHKRLQSAITKHKQTHPTDTFTTTWKPFQLNPDAPKVGIPKRALYEQKFGGPAVVNGMFERLSKVGNDVGIYFNYGGMTGNTRNSHRLIAAAQAKEARGDEADKGLQTRLVESLFRMYFEEEGDITSSKALQKAAVDAGMNEGEVATILAGNAEGDVVDRELADAREKEIHGVPYFEINGRFAVEGAQESRAFEQLFARIKSIEQRNGGGSSRV